MVTHVNIKFTKFLYKKKISFLWNICNSEKLKVISMFTDKRMDDTYLCSVYYPVVKMIKL